MYYELELNHGWMYGIDDDDFPLGEKNFVIPAEYFYSLMEMFGMDDAEASDFLDWYDPDVDGRFIYEFAVRDGAIVEEGTHYYGMNDDILRGCILQSYND